MCRIKFYVSFTGSRKYCGQGDYDAYSSARSRLLRAATRVPFVEVTTAEGEREVEEYEEVIVDFWTDEELDFAEEVASDPEFYLENFPEYFIDRDVNRLSDAAPKYWGVGKGGEAELTAEGRVAVAAVVDYGSYGGEAEEALNEEEREEILEAKAREAYRRALRKLGRTIPFFVDADEYDEVFRRAEIAECRK